MVRASFASIIVAERNIFGDLNGSTKAARVAAMPSSDGWSCRSVMRCAHHGVSCDSWPWLGVTVVSRAATSDQRWGGTVSGAAALGQLREKSSRYPQRGRSDAQVLPAKPRCRNEPAVRQLLTISKKTVNVRSQSQIEFVTTGEVAMGSRVVWGGCLAIPLFDQAPGAASTVYAFPCTKDYC